MGHPAHLKLWEAWIGGYMCTNQLYAVMTVCMTFMQMVNENKPVHCVMRGSGELP